MIPYEGPLDHVDHSRIVSLGAVLAPNEHYGLDFNYAYSDVYTATNICYDNGAQNASTVVGLPGTASLNSSGGPNVCLGVVHQRVNDAACGLVCQGLHGCSHAVRIGDVQHVSRQQAVHSNIGYRISAVNGSQFFNDARAVNGSLASRISLRL